MSQTNFSSFSSEVVERFKVLQDDICAGLEDLDGQGKFQEDLWERPGGGGGRTRVIEGTHIEKGGVNFSAVYGSMPEVVAKELNLPSNRFIATGVSIVLHAKNPYVPIIHMNVRYFETDKGHWWFGGGIDVTPIIVFPNDARDFHIQMKEVCDRYSDTAYAEYKKWADDYFFIKHRNETRGVGGIFFDRLTGKNDSDQADLWKFVVEVGESFVPAYSQLFTGHYQDEYGHDEEEWQMIRRGRYVEFNLVYDRGTKFGLQTSGRIESILMSLPPQARWKYDYARNHKPFEMETLSYLKKDIDWVNL